MPETKTTLPPWAQFALVWVVFVLVVVLFYWVCIEPLREALPMSVQEMRRV